MQRCERDCADKYIVICISTSVITITVKLILILFIFYPVVSHLIYMCVNFNIYYHIYVLSFILQNRGLKHTFSIVKTSTANAAVSLHFSQIIIQDKTIDQKERALIKCHQLKALKERKSVETEQKLISY